MRKLKALGLTFVAALALGAVTATMVSAEEEGGKVIDGTFEAIGEPAHIVGEDLVTEVGEEEVRPEFTSNLGNITCDETSYTGELEGVSKTVTITPDYKKCMSGNRPATVTMNGCNYLFHVGTDTGDDEYHGTADLVCPPEKTVEAHIYPASTEEPHEAGSLCTYTIPEEGNTGLPVTLQDSGENSIALSGSVQLATEVHGACTFFTTKEVATTQHLSAAFEGTNTAVDIG